MSEPRSRWQHIRYWRFVLLIGVGILIILAALVYGICVGIRSGWDWTGFFGGDGITTKTTTVSGVPTATQHLPVRTLWDWMQLLLVPVMLAAGGLWLNQRQKNREERIAEQRRKTEREAAERRAQADRELAADNQREIALQSYIDKIGELLLHEQLGKPSNDPNNSQVENVARARTVTVLRVLDPSRRASLLQFLSQAGILRVCTEGNLANIDLHETDLVRLDLSEFNLNGADLREAKLSFGITLADIRRAGPSGAKLGGAHLRGADLRRAYLSRADLREANLAEADLREADLSGAYLSGAYLRGADLRGASLRSAVGLTDEQRADYQSRGALIKPIFNIKPISYQSRSTVSPPTSSTSQHDGEKGQSPTPVQVLLAETPPIAGDTVSPKQEEDVADDNGSGAPFSQPDSPS